MQALLSCGWGWHLEHTLKNLPRTKLPFASCSPHICSHLKRLFRSKHQTRDYRDHSSKRAKPCAYQHSHKSLPHFLWGAAEQFETWQQTPSSSPVW